MFYSFITPISITILLAASIHTCKFEISKSERRRTAVQCSIRQIRYFKLSYLKRCTDSNLARTWSRGLLLAAAGSSRPQRTCYPNGLESSALTNPCGLLSVQLPNHPETFDGLRNAIVPKASLLHNLYVCYNPAERNTTDRVKIEFSARWMAGTKSTKLFAVSEKRLQPTCRAEFTLCGLVANPPEGSFQAA